MGRSHCRPPSLNIEASTLAAISGLRRRDTMPEMAVSGAGPFRKRPDYGLDAKMRAKTDDASSNWCSQVGPQILSPSASLYRGPIVQLEADLGSMLIIWARAGALPTPLEPSKSIESSLCPRPRRFAAQLVASRAEARRVCCSRGWVVCCSDGSGDHDDRSCVAFAYGRAVWMGPEAPWRVFVGAW